MRPLLIVPGYTNSGPEHWQILWERRTPGAFHEFTGEGDYDAGEGSDEES